MRLIFCLLVAALLSTGCSQLVIVPDAPDGSSTSVDVAWEKGTYTFGKQGYGFYIDRVFDVVYRIDAEDIERDFGPALQSMRDVLATGMPELPHSYAALLESEKGPLGTLTIQTGEGEPVVLSQAGQGVFIDGYPDRPHPIDAAHLARDFDSALETQADTLKAMQAYLALLEPPKGYEHPTGLKDTILYQPDGSEPILVQAGQALTLDGTERVTNAEEIESDFGPALLALRQVLADGLPELPHSYAVQLPHDLGPLGDITFQSSDQAIQYVVDGAFEGVFIDGYPDRPHPIDKQTLVRDFKPALVSLTQALKSLRSYIILLKSPFGEISKVIYRTRGEDILLDHPGQSLTLDGIDNIPDELFAEKDFTPAKSSTRQILDEGLPKLPHSYVALVAHPSGPLGEVEILEGLPKGTLLNESLQAVIIDGYSDKIYRLDEQQYQVDFGDSMAAMPPPPVTHYLYFDSGSDRLTRDSQAVMPLIYEAIRQHPAADISINGHADTVGKDELNDEISLKRSETIAALIRKSGVPTQEISLAAFGKTDLAVETPDNTPELLNRRVEIIIR